jgi:sulfur carrier protein ThiS
LPVKVWVKLVGFPEIRQRLGCDRIQVDLEGQTLGDLLRWLQRTQADPVQTALLDPAGRPDPSVQVIRNGQEWIAPDRADCELFEGDQITLMVLVAGG